MEYTNRFALLSDSVESANEASTLHISSPLHSTPKRTNKRDQRSDATSAVKYSPIDGAQPKTSDQMNTIHGFSCTVSHTTHSSMSSSQQSSSDAGFEHSTDETDLIENTYVVPGMSDQTRFGALLQYTFSV